MSGRSIDERRSSICSQWCAPPTLLRMRCAPSSGSKALRYASMRPSGFLRSRMLAKSKVNSTRNPSGRPRSWRVSEVLQVWTGIGICMGTTCPSPVRSSASAVNMLGAHTSSTSSNEYRRWSGNCSASQNQTPALLRLLNMERGKACLDIANHVGVDAKYIGIERTAVVPSIARLVSTPAVCRLPRHRTRRDTCRSGCLQQQSCCLANTQLRVEIAQDVEAGPRRHGVSTVGVGGLALCNPRCQARSELSRNLGHSHFVITNCPLAECMRTERVGQRFDE